jgi:hypothetical protein
MSYEAWGEPDSRPWPAQRPTYRSILVGLLVGQSHTFDTRTQAMSARASASMMYDGRKFTLDQLTITRTK